MEHKLNLPVSMGALRLTPITEAVAVVAVAESRSLAKRLPLRVTLERVEKPDRSFWAEVGPKVVAVVADERRVERP